MREGEGARKRREGRERREIPVLSPVPPQAYLRTLVDAAGCSSSVEVPWPSQIWSHPTQSHDIWRAVRSPMSGSALKSLCLPSAPLLCAVPYTSPKASKLIIIRSNRVSSMNQIALRIDKKHIPV